MRKTVDRDVIVSVINTHLKTGSNSNKQERVALILAFEDIMFKAGTYKGFRYLGTSDMTGDVEGMWPGIRGAGTKDDPYDFTCTDNTRREYF